MVRFLAGAVALAYSLQVTRAVSEWGQCGGINYTGAACDSGLICVEQNPYYYQCLPGSTSLTSTTPPLTTSSVHTSSTTSSKASSTSTVKTSSSTKSTSTSSLSSKTTSTSSKPTTTSTTTSQVTSPTTTVTSTYTGTLPIGTLSPTGLAAAAKKKNKYIGSSYDNVDIANTTYTQLVLSQVNAMTPENSMKWDSLEQTQGAFNTSLWADRVVNITQLNHLYLRGHTLVWYSQLPAWVTSGGFNNASLIAVMENHITNVMARWKGEIYIWDVVNEPLNDDGTLRASIFYTTIGEYYIDMAFNTAKATDSNAILAVNDYNIEGSGAKSTGMISLVSRVKARGVPIEQIGIQGHLIVGEVPTTMTANWNAFVALGVSIAVTELDIRMPTPASTANLAQQATDYTTVVNTCLGITQCLGITFWGLSDAFSWIPSTFSGYGAATPYDEAFNPKPAYTAILAALNA